MVNINMAMNATVRMKAGENDLAVFYIGYFVMADSIDFWTSKNPNLPKPCIMLGILGAYILSFIMGAILIMKHFGLNTQN